jgi:hypothetical protein
MELLKELSQETEAWTMDQIRAAQESISLTTDIRERYGGDWEVEELTRSIIFEEVKFIEKMGAEAENARATREELGNV